MNSLPNGNFDATHSFFYQLSENDFVMKKAEGSKSNVVREVTHNYKMSYSSDILFQTHANKSRLPCNVEVCGQLEIFTAKFYYLRIDDANNLKCFSTISEDLLMSLFSFDFCTEKWKRSKFLSYTRRQILI